MVGNEDLAAVFPATLSPGQCLHPSPSLGGHLGKSLLPILLHVGGRLSVLLYGPHLHFTVCTRVRSVPNLEPPFPDLGSTQEWAASVS